MKRVLVCLSTLFLALFILCACGGNRDLDANGFPKLYNIPPNCLNADEVDWETLLPTIPDDHYIEYPGVHTVPVTATLYKDGTEVALDSYDPRLIRLMNFYNNALYHGEFDHTFGGYPPDQYQQLIENNPFRLELTYVPRKTGSEETSFDKLVILHRSVLAIRSNTPFGDYPMTVFGRTPFHFTEGSWFLQFGF